MARGLQAPTAEDAALQEAVRRLRAAYRPERIYLFGSVARGDAGADSDYDLLLVVGDDADAEQLDGGRAYEVLWGTGAAVDVVICTAGAFERKLSVPSSLPATAVREGKLLDAA